MATVNTVENLQYAWLDKLAAGTANAPAPEPDRTPTWGELVQAEPGLLRLEQAARSLHRSAPGDWVAWSEQIKQPMCRLVGWDARRAELCTMAAYDVAFCRLLNCWETGGPDA